MMYSDSQYRFRHAALQTTHHLSHPGNRATAKLITKRFVSSNIHKNSIAFAKSCIRCQRSKVMRHTQSPVSRYWEPDSRFAHINIDIVGPFPQSRENRYYLTVIDRFIRWSEAFPIPDMTVPTIAETVVIFFYNVFCVTVFISFL